jgi:hypothetical protein
MLLFMIYKMSMRKCFWPGHQSENITQAVHNFLEHQTSSCKQEGARANEVIALAFLKLAPTLAKQPSPCKLYPWFSYMQLLTGQCLLLPCFLCLQGRAPLLPMVLVCVDVLIYIPRMFAVSSGQEPGQVFPPRTAGAMGV